MKKYFLGLFCLLIIASSLFVGVNKVSALTVADIDMLVALGIISPDKADAAKTAIGGSVVITTIKPSITVLSPNAGETIKSGQIYQITWKTNGILASQDMKISLINTDTGELEIISNGCIEQGVIASTPSNNQNARYLLDSCSGLSSVTKNTGYYNWTVPTNLTGSHYLIYVGELKIMGDSDTTDNYFTISSNTSTSTQSLVTATIVDTPTLKLSYDNSSSRSKNESLLTANFKVRVKASSVDSVIYLNFANVEFVNKTGASNQNTNTKTTVITSSLGLYKEGIDQYGRKYIIVPANSEVDFKVEATRKPSELFAGSYTASLLNLVNYNDSFEYGTQQIKVSENKTNSVTIVGEKSPYIESVSSTQIKCSGCDSIVTIKGVRMNNSTLANSSNLYGLIYNWKVSSDGKTITFNTKIVGSYNIRLSDTKTGLSNGFVVNIESIALESLVTITSPRKNFTVGNTFKASGLCTNYQGNVSVYYYSTRKVSVDALCSNGKWSTDINLETNALSGTFTLYASLSTGQQVTLELPFKIKQITSLDPSITISDESGNQGLTVNIGDNFTISGTPKNLQGLQYGYLQGNYSRAYFFDSIFNGSCFKTDEGSNNGVWFITCNAKTSGVSKFYIEIYKDGKTYRSNDVVVTVNKAINQPSITIISPNGGEVWKAGTTQTIKWQAENFNGSVVYVELRPSMSRLSGSSKIALGSPIHGEMSWEIPKDLAPGQYRIELYKASDRGVIDPNEKVKDVSDNYFTISPEDSSCTYNYSDWGECINGTQTRTRSTISSRCDIPTTPVLSQPCTVTPPVVDSDSYCGSKTQRPLVGGCGSKKTQVTQAGVVLSSSDVIEVIKISNYYRSGVKIGASIVACPLNTNYRVCVENGNDGAANYILLGVKSAPLNYNSSRTTASALESMKIEDIIQLLKMIK